MKTAPFTLASALLLGLLTVTTQRHPVWAQAAGQVPAQTAATVPALLGREQASAVMPPTVFYRGRTASIQARNSAGLRLSGGRLVLVAAVDTSGYSSSIQESYQDYLITEVPLEVGGKPLAPGAYGAGFIAGDKFIVLDVGAHALLTVPSVRDAGLSRPNPLQILPDPSSDGHFRLYSGRNYVTLTPAP